MIKVNLVPQEILDKELQKQRLAQVSVAAAFLAVIFVIVSGMHYYTSVRLGRELDADQAEFKRLEVIVKKVEAVEAQAQAVRSHLAVIQELLAARTFYPRFMTELVKAIGDGVWLTSLSAAGDAKAGLKVQLACKSVSSEAATRWLRALQDSPVFVNPALGGLTMAPDGTVTFPMSLTYKEPAPSGGRK
ncbi:MAG: PilN domain-containing protein [Elusimicrobia bacterium]|nr:PilN domain-containing protein [Elusimicrobiota bacterium]